MDKVDDYELIPRVESLERELKDLRDNFFSAADAPLAEARNRVQNAEAALRLGWHHLFDKYATAAVQGLLAQHRADGDEHRNIETLAVFDASEPNDRAHLMQCAFLLALDALSLRSYCQGVSGAVPPAVSLAREHSEAMANAVRSRFAQVFGQLEGGQ